MVVNFFKKGNRADPRYYREITPLTLLGPQPRFGDEPLNFEVICPQNGTAVPKELSTVPGGQNI